MSTTLGHDTVDILAEAPPDRSGWKAIIARYQGSDVARSVFQIVTTLVPLAIAFIAMHWSLGVSYWLTALLTLPTAGLLVRTFIIMHDCTHNSFLPSRKWNDIIGYVTGVLTLTPFDLWRRTHAIHHAGSGNLARRVEHRVSMPPDRALHLHVRKFASHESSSCPRGENNA